MLEVAFLAAHLLWMTGRDDIERLYDMTTVAPAKAMNLSDHAPAVGAPANLVVLGEPDVVEALRFHAAPRHVVSRGRRVDLARMRALAGATARTTGNQLNENAASLRRRSVAGAPAERQSGAPEPDAFAVTEAGRKKRRPRKAAEYRRRSYAATFHLSGAEVARRAA